MTAAYFAASLSVNRQPSQCSFHLEINMSMYDRDWYRDAQRSVSQRESFSLASTSLAITFIIVVMTLFASLAWMAGNTNFFQGPQLYIDSNTPEQSYLGDSYEAQRITRLTEKHFSFDAQSAESATQWHTFATYAFLNTTWLSLGLVLTGLVVFGGAAELSLGTRWMAVIALASILTASGAHYFLHRPSLLYGGAPLASGLSAACVVLSPRLLNNLGFHNGGVVLRLLGLGFLGISFAGYLHLGSTREPLFIEMGASVAVASVLSIIACRLCVLRASRITR